MPDNIKYPRFGGDRKLSANAWCECCENAHQATHAVDVQVDHFRGNDDVYHVCGFHVGQARRPHTFEKFMAAAEGRD